MSQSKVIFKNQHYTACAMVDGSLIVTKNKMQKGIHLVGAQAPIWIDAIETAIDASEANALCRAMFNQ